MRRIKRKRGERILAWILCMAILLQGTPVYAADVQDQIPYTMETQESETIQPEIEIEEAKPTPQPEETETGADSDVPQVEENTEDTEDTTPTETTDFSSVYENGVIKIYNASQLEAIGSGQAVHLQDDQQDGFGTGEEVIENGTVVQYALDAKYQLMNEIELSAKKLWSLPDGFTGTFSGAPSETDPLYDNETDTIYVYNNYQLQLIASDTSEKEPVMSQDMLPENIGIGQFLYKDGTPTDDSLEAAQEYLTYSKAHRYVLAMNFTEKMPEVLAEKYAAGELTPEQLGGRDHVGQQYVKLDGKEYILIGNEQQLRAIGSGKQVTPMLFLRTEVGLLVKKKTIIPYYPGDADFNLTNISDTGILLGDVDDKSTDFQYKTQADKMNELMSIEWSSKNLIDGIFDTIGGLLEDLGAVLGASKQLVGFKVDENNNVSISAAESLFGNPEGYTSFDTLKKEYEHLKYTSDANYIIFRDIDLQNKDWTPLMFSGTMIGAKGNELGEPGSLWKNGELNTKEKPVISNISIEQTTPIDTKKQAGVGFFGSIMSTSKKQIGLSDKTVVVKNIKLQNISVHNHAKQTAERPKGLVDILLKLLGGITGILLGDLGKALDSLLNPDGNGDPTVFATGAFAGRIMGDVHIEGCEVENISGLSNVKDLVGGFAGHIEGLTEYGALQEALGGVTDFLTKLLDILPFIDLGTLIHVLLDGNILDLDKLIPTGYKNPMISNCHIMQTTPLMIGNKSQNYVGGFAGKVIGTIMKDCSIDAKQTDISLIGKNMVGGFNGFTANAELVGLLDSLGVDLVNSLRLNSYVLGCSIHAKNLAVKADGTATGPLGDQIAGQYSGGMTGAMASSFLVDSTVGVDGTATIHAEKYAGGLTGIATLGQAVSLSDFYAGKKDLTKLISKLLSGTLTGDMENTLLSITGINPSILAGDEIRGSLSVSVKKDYGGGFVGQGDGLKILSSADVSSKSYVWKNTIPNIGYTTKNRGNMLSNLIKIEGKNLVGGLIGEARTASASGLLNHTLGIGNFLKFEIENVQLTNASTGGVVTAGNNFAGGMAGRASGGNVSKVTVENLQKVTTNNYAGGFVGYGGTGSLAETASLNILGLIEISNLLSLADGLQLQIQDSHVSGSQDGLTVIATGESQDVSDIKKYYAGGFIGKSTSVKIEKANVTNLKNVSADMQNGCAGGFSGKNETGGLADAAGTDTEALKLLKIEGLLNAIPYLVSDFKNVTVTFLPQSDQPQMKEPQVKANCAGGFVGEMQSGKIDNQELKESFAVYKANFIQGEHYAGGFAGKMYSGGIASADGLSVLNGALTIKTEDLLGLLNVYIPSVKYAGVSSDGLCVEAQDIDSSDLNSGSAGGYVGFGSGVKISHSDVKELKHTKVTPPSDLLNDDGSSYFGQESEYAVKGVSNAGGYVGKLDIGSSAALGGGLELLDKVLNVSNLAQALDVVASEIEYSNVYGAVGGFSVKSSGELKKGDEIGNAGGFAGSDYGSQIQNSNVYNFDYIIGKETAGGYVGNFQPGNVANVIGKTEVLGGLLSTNENLLSVLQSFIPMIYNSETTAVPCGGSVRADGQSDNMRARGLAGGYVGYNLGGRIEGNSSRAWNGAEPTGQKESAVYRLRSVYGYEFSGGYSGRTESANVADTGNLKVLFGLIKLDNPLQAVQAVYPTETNTAVYGPLRGLNVDTWNKWVNAVGVNGGYGQQLQGLGAVSTQEELNKIIDQYAYGYDVKAGRQTAGNTATQGGVAGGYVGRMDGGVIESAHAMDLKKAIAYRTSGGFAGEMMTGGVANVGGINVAGIEILGQTSVLKTFVPIIKTSSVTGYRSGATIVAEGTDLTNRQGNAGGFVGIAVGGQILGTKAEFCSTSKLKKIAGTNTIGGFAGSILTGSALDVNTSSNDGLLPALLKPLLGNAGDLAKILNATVSTVKYAKVEAWDDWGLVIDGTYKKSDVAETQYAYAAGGFVGSTSGSVIGDRTAKSDSIVVMNLRNVTAGEHAGGCFGLADVSAVTQVGNDQSEPILGLIGLGELDVLDAFRSYVYHASIQGSNDQGLTVSANVEKSEGVLNSTLYTGNAGGFGGSAYNSSVKDSTVTKLNQVNALNYSGGFIGHMGKSGAVDLNKVEAGEILGGLLNATAGVMDNFGSHADRCTVNGYQEGYIINSQDGKEPIAGGFVGYADLAKIDKSHATEVKKVTSDQIAGGFVGKTSFSYLADIDTGSNVLLDPIFSVVNKLLDLLYLDELENLGNIQIGGGLVLKVELLKEGNLLSVTLLGLRITVGLVKNNGDGTSDLAQIHIGDTYIEIPCSDLGGNSGNHISEKDKENLKIGLIKSNRTRIENSTITGIPIGYDVFAGGANDAQDGQHQEGKSGGFVGFNNEGLLDHNDMYYADTIRGTQNLVGPFSGETSLDSSYHFNKVANIEGDKNYYRVYRSHDNFDKLITGNGKEFDANSENQTWNEFIISHIINIPEYGDLNHSNLSSGTEKVDANIYISASKAVLMQDQRTSDNSDGTVAPPPDMQDPCDENIHLTINKKWKDLLNIDKMRPDHIKVYLTRTYKLGEEIVEDQEFKQTIEIKPSDQKNIWQHVVKDLPAYKVLEDGSHAYYKYEISEDPVNGYDAAIEKSEDGFTFTITNTHIPMLPDTGGMGTYIIYGFGLILLAASVISFCFRRKRKA